MLWPHLKRFFPAMYLVTLLKTLWNAILPLDLLVVFAVNLLVGS